MKHAYVPIVKCDYGPLDPKVELKPDFFTGFVAAKRDEITSKEADFYHSITKQYSVDDLIDKRLLTIQAKDGTKITVKEYRPRNCSESIPAVMFFHGGGFVTCTIETHDYVPSYLAAKANVAVYSVQYRLAPEYPYPAGIEDCYSACQYVAERASELRIDKDHITVAGDSSGGNFAAVICLMARDRKDLKIDKQVLIYPVTDVTNKIHKDSMRVYGNGEASDEPAWYLKAYLPDVSKFESNPYVSPMWADDFNGLPPALFIDAECDTLLDDGLIYANLLKQDGVKVEVHIYKGMPHAFILRTYKETFEALDQIVEFIKHD